MNAQTIAIHFADQLCRERALTPAESEMLMTIVEKQRRRIWTAEDDRKLMRMNRLKPAYVIADEIGRTPHAVRTRIRDLKRKEVGRGVQSAGA